MFDIDQPAGDPVVIREGSSHRTAEELCLVFVCDVADLAEDLGALPDHITRCRGLVDKAKKALAEDDLDALDDYAAIAELALADIGEGSLWVDWCDGYVIYESEV